MRDSDSSFPVSREICFGSSLSSKVGMNTRVGDGRPDTLHFEAPDNPGTFLDLFPLCCVTDEGCGAEL